MKVMKMKIIRMLDAEMNIQRSEEQEQESEGMVVEGYALKFDEIQESNDPMIGRYKEYIKKEAFENANLEDVILDLNHDFNIVLARTTNGTLNLEVDDIGLKVRSTIADTSHGRDVFKMISDGLITKMSFCVELLEDEWTEEKEDESSDAIPIRALTKFGRFFDVSAVTFPFYDATEIAKRYKIENDDLLKRYIERNANDEEIIDEVIEEVVEEVEDNEEIQEQVNEEIQIEERKEIENMENVEMKMDVENIVQKSEKLESTIEYRNAYFEAIRGNDAELRSMTTTSHNVVIPTFLSDKIETAIREGGKIASLCSRNNIKGWYSVPVETASSDATLDVEDGSEPTEESITMVEVLMKPQNIHKWIAISKALESVAIEQFVEYIADEIANKVLEKLDDQIIGGLTTDGVQGIINATSNFQTTAVVTDYTTGGFVGQSDIKSGRNIKCVISRAFFMTNIMTLKDTTGNPIFTAINENGRTIYYYNGMEVVFTNSTKMAQSTSETAKPWIICGDFANYTLNFPNGYGVEILRDPYTKAPNGMIRYNGDLVVGGAITGFKAFFVGKMQ